MKAIATEGYGAIDSAEDALRLVIDTTPALIHTGRPTVISLLQSALVGVPGSVLGRGIAVGGGPVQFTPKCSGFAAEWHAVLGWRALEAEARVRRADGEYRLLLHRKCRCAANEALFLSGTGQASTSRSKGGLRKGSCRTKGSGLAKTLLAEAQRLTQIGASVQRLTRIAAFCSPP